MWFSEVFYLLAMSEKREQADDNSHAFGLLLTNLSKAFDCLPHQLLIGKLNSCGFGLKALKLINDYLSQRNQRTKISKSCSSWEQIWSPSRADYMGETGSLLTHLGCFKLSQIWTFFLYFITKKCIRSITEVRVDQKYYFIVLFFLNSKDQFYNCLFSFVLHWSGYIGIFAFGAGLTPNCYDFMRFLFMANLWLIYGSLNL